MPARRPVVAVLIYMPLAAAIAPLTAPAAAPARRAHQRSPARSVPRGFLGTVADGPVADGTVSLASQTGRMAAAGVETLGASFDWSNAQPYASGDRVPRAVRARFHLEGGVPTNFEFSDKVVATAARRGIAVCPTVIVAPVWDRLHPESTFSPPAEAAPYAAYAAALARRYGPGGSFWSKHPKLTPLPIRSWQIWNEPAGGLTPTSPSVFWVDTAQFQPRYVALLHAAHDAIKGVDAGAQVIVAGLLGRSWQTLQTLYDAGARPYFDAVAIHPYTSFPNNVLKILRRVHATLLRNRDAGKPLFLSEVGWPSFDVPGIRRLGLAGAKRYQAQWLKQVFTRLVSTRRRYRVAQILWYRWLGTDSSQDDPFDYAGLLHLDPSSRRIRAEPAFAAFASLAHKLE